MEKFLKTAGDSLNSFRYFRNRNFDAIDNHILTLIGIADNKPVSYGHLDKENDTIWLGLAVVESYKGKGLGKDMMEQLINSARSMNIPKITLAVDKSNLVAQRLYKNYGFVNKGTLNEKSLKFILKFHDES